MRLTKQTNHTVRILMYCAANGPDSTSRITVLAKAYCVPELYLFKILHPLVKCGLVHSIRGRNGGIQLGRSADAITLLDVVQLNKDGFSMAECSESKTMDQTDRVMLYAPAIPRCALRLMHFGVLAKYTIAELVRTRSDISGLDLLILAKWQATGENMQGKSRGTGCSPFKQFDAAD